MSPPPQIEPKSTIFFVCDIQERFRSGIHEYEQVIATAKKMLAFAKILGIGVIVTEQNPKALGSTVSELYLELQALEKADLLLGCHPKNAFSMMIPPVLDALTGYKSVVIFGIESHICVLQTTLALLRQPPPLTIQPYVLRDGVSSCNPQEIDIACDYMRSVGAVVTTSESILFQLMGDAGLPLFKPFANEVKQYKDCTSVALQRLVGSPTGAGKSKL